MQFSLVKLVLVLIVVVSTSALGLSWFANQDVIQNTARQEIVHTGDLVVSNGTYTIDNSNFIIKGNMIINGSGKLLAENSEITFRQDYNQQYTFRTHDNAVIEMHNVKLNTEGKWFNLNYNDNTSVKFDKVEGNGCCLPWHSANGNVKISAKDSRVGVTINQNVSVSAEDSTLFFELVLTNVSGEFRLPKGHVEKFNLEIQNWGSSLMSLNISKSEFTDWGTTLDRYSNVTFIDSSMTIGMNAGSDWTKPNPVVKISDLKTKTYDRYSFAFDTNNLTLINTYVRDWYPQAWNNATVEISNSDIADVQFNGVTATVIVVNSNAFIAIARENVTYKFYNSTIRQDVIANENSQIYLYNTDVGGMLLENDHGKIFVDGKRLNK